MGLFRSNQDRPPIRVANTLAPAEPDVTVEAARIALAVAVIDEALAGGREGHGRFLNALLEVRHALAPATRPLDPPVPVIPGRSS